jgi:hypothetical protein
MITLLLSRDAYGVWHIGDLEQVGMQIKREIIAETIEQD